ncbi:MAG: GNAT family N-acetyltransferase [Phenylobacterium sp.]|uniref:GNAT family N-acetyltransferase n=1 Tax=Phenylobacterium sp. TaxID=1871053 RepID=UPI002734B031|nr:GNAT family N-acetyltransferase [Phenylobacterium sp.]MDP3175451.1 GNAT family N-acetyltransferase [Phenylobacterium sp.]
MLQADTLHPRDLAPADDAVWRLLCATDVALSGPLLGPDFARAVGDVREDARVTVWREDGAAVGFLAHHRRPGAFARPIGAPLSDYHGLVARQRLDPPEALAAAGLNAFRFTGLIDPTGALKGAIKSTREAFVIVLDGSAEAYLETLRAASPKRFKNYRRLDHKLERDVGPLSVVAPDRSIEAFETLIAWKRDQLERTGGHDFLRPAWTDRLMRSLLARTDGDFQGLMVNLYAGERLVGGHFGIRLGAQFHPWIASMDPELAAWSPGQVFLSRAISAMPSLGLLRYDLGPGHEHYKRPFASQTVSVHEGLATTLRPAGRAMQAFEDTWALAGARRGGAVERLRRRLDVIATVELSLPGRARALAQAFAAQTRRRQAADSEIAG